MKQLTKLEGIEMKPVTFIIVGAGARGATYAGFIKKCGGSVVGVADPIDWRRERFMRTHEIPEENVFTDWKDLAARERFADAVIVATGDRLHVEPAVAFAGKGYSMMLEKPMAPTEEDCRRIVEAVVANDILFAVCHVMRYTDYTQKFKELVDSGVIGDIVGIQHLEPVGYWHFTHSFVRGMCGREADSSPVLLAKCCHDLDWIHYIMGTRCEAVSSFGTLKHYCREQKPEGAADRCLDCKIEPTCPYSARKIYLSRVAQGQTGWPVSVLVEEVSVESVTDALRHGPYGRCVYACDNDVCDNQVVNMLFEGGQTATFTMTGFAESGGRRTRVFGTAGQLCGNGHSTIEHYDFLADRTEVIDTKAPDASTLGGHGGGDGRLVERFMSAVAQNDRSKILSGPKETLESHLIVFAAERARRENLVVSL